MLATIRYTKGLGNAALYVRATDDSVPPQFWSWGGAIWVASDTSPVRTFLTECADADPLESAYKANVFPPPTATLLEYVRVSDGKVIGEDPLNVQSILSAVTTGVGAGLLTVTVEDALAAPVVGATVYLRDAGSGSVVAYGSTDAFGHVALAHQGGSLQVVAWKAAMAFPVAALTLTAGQVATATVQAIASGAVPATNPNLCTLFGTALRPDGTPAVGAVATLELAVQPGKTRGPVQGSFLVGSDTSVADGAGLVSWQVLRGALVRASCPGCFDKVATVPNLASADLATL